VDGDPVSGPAPLGHVGLTVEDVEAAVEWYGRVFGWGLLMGPVEVSTEDPRVAEQLRDVFGEEDVAFRQAHLDMGEGVALELFQFTRPRASGHGHFEFSKGGVFHLCLQAPQIEELAARIEAEGGRRRTEIQPIFPGEPYRFCYCEDPFGNVIELATHPHAESFGGRAAY
jgi:catechol 2,3-dioxygenase-like lactoylglutathione lyase family enzyme